MVKHIIVYNPNHHYNLYHLNPFNTLRIPFRVPDPDYIYTMNHMKDNWNMIKYQTNLFMYILNLDFIRPLISKRALDSFIFSTNVLFSIWLSCYCSSTLVLSEYVQVIHYITHNRKGNISKLSPSFSFQLGQV